MKLPPVFLVALAAGLLASAVSRVSGQPGPPGPLGARPGPPVVERVSPRVTGNPFTQVWRVEDCGGGVGNSGIVQHPESGFIYVGNSHGVLEYDGARWTLIPLPHGGAVLAVAVDAAGSVWAVSENEVARIQPDAEGAWQADTVVYPLPEGEAGLMDQLLAMPDGMWVRGLQHVLRIGPEDRVSTWRSEQRFGLVWRMEGGVHVRLADRGVVRLEAEGRLVTVVRGDTLPELRNRPSPFRVYASRQVSDGEWRLLSAVGPAVWRKDTGTWQPWPLEPALFREAEASAATFLPDGSMVFVTTRPGVFVVNPRGRIDRLLDRLPGVLDLRITQVASDREGGLWLCTRDQIVRLNLNSGVMRHEGAHGLRGSPRHLLRHGDELLVAHTAGVSRRRDWPGEFPPVAGLHHGAETLAVVGDRVFAAAAGLVELAEGARQAKFWSTQAFTSVTGLRAVPGSLLGGSADGVWWFRDDGEGWKPVGRLSRVPAGVSSIHDRGDGWIWGATIDGRLWRADFRKGPSLEAPVRIWGPAEGVAPFGRAGRTTFFDLGGAVVAASPAWILRHEPTNDRFEPETRIEGIPASTSRGVEAVGANPDGSVWLRLAPPDRRLLRVTPAGTDHWQATELVAPMIRDLSVVHLLEDRDTLWVAGKDLLVSIDLRWRPAEEVPLHAQLRQVRSAHGRILWRQRAGRAEAPLHLEEEEESVRVEFAAASFAVDHRGRSCVQFRSWIEGLDRDWQAWSGEPWRDITRLPAGRYLFRLQAADQAGRVSPEVSLPLVIRAPWWQTRMAWSAYGAAALLALVGGVRLRTRALRRRAEWLEQQVALRTEELQRSNAELARLHRLELDEKAAARLAEEEARLEVLRYQLNPHFLYNALNSIYSLVLTAPPAAASMVLRLADFCRIALDRRQEEQTTVGAEFDKLSIYFEIEKARWGESLHITLEAGEEARRSALPPFLLLPLVENAMKYGGATSPGELRVRVAARLERQTLWLTVANTGSWVDRSGPVPATSGIGLSNLRQRLLRYHPDAHEVAIDTRDGWVVVTLVLHLDRRRAPVHAHAVCG
ncbi:MAG: histidine kinase [Verrucomicrobia bacterium]|nr:histidine kinase [Verrucomicrobiota bacterium]